MRTRDVNVLHGACVVCVCVGGASGKTSAIDAWGEGGEGVEGGEREWLKRRRG